MKDYFTNTEADAGRFELMFNDEPPERPSPDEYSLDFGGVIGAEGPDGQGRLHYPRPEPSPKEPE